MREGYYSSLSETLPNDHCSVPYGANIVLMKRVELVVRERRSEVTEKSDTYRDSALVMTM